MLAPTGYEPVGPTILPPNVVVRSRGRPRRDNTTRRDPSQWELSSRLRSTPVTRQPLPQRPGNLGGATSLIDTTQATALTATPATPATPNNVATAVVTPADDPLFNIDDFGDFNNFDDTVLDELDNDTGAHDPQFDVNNFGDELDNDTGTHDPQFDVDDFCDFYNFELDELDGGTGTHPGTGTVAQAPSQFEDDTPLAPAQLDGIQKRKRGRPKGSKDKQARKKRQKRTEANAPQAGFSAGAV
ncbi:hypothetical protein V8E54_007915 [Elaphomyces granulatus]